MLKFQLTSGKIVKLNLADIETALNLYRAVIHECKGAGLDITTADDTTVGDLLLKNIEALLNIIGSARVIEAIKECCSKVVYDDKRFSMEIFNEDEKARNDFFGLMSLVAVENLRPFFPQAHIIFNAIASQFLKN